LAKSRRLSDITKQLISNSLKGKLNPFFNKTHSTNSIDKFRLSYSLGVVYGYICYNNLQVILPYVGTLAKYLKNTSSSINNYMEKGMLFRGG
jgi:hypothetical protein